MIAELLALALSLPGVSSDSGARARAEKAVHAVVRVVEISQPLPLGPTHRERQIRTARLLVVWSFLESSWFVNAVGDAGHSIGLLQCNRAQVEALRVTAKDVLSSRERAISVGLYLMRRNVRQCGSVEKGLGAYAGRDCGDASYLVRRRCRLAGAC